MKHPERLSLLRALFPFGTFLARASMGAPSSSAGNATQMSKWGSISAWSLLLLSLLSISTQGQTITTWFGDGTESVLHAPSGLFIASGDTVYIADTGNHRIRRIDPTGSSTIVAGNGS